MAVNQDDIIALLKETHLFRKFTDEQLVELAAQFEPVHTADKQVIHKRGDRTDSFNLIFEGKVLLATPGKEGNRMIATLVRGDYFGEELATSHPSRPTMAIASGNVTLLRLSPNKFRDLPRKFKEFAPNLQIVLTSRSLAKQPHQGRLDFLNDDEVVYLMGRRHEYFLWSKVLPSLGILAFGVLCGIGLFYLVKPFAVDFMYCALAWAVLFTGVTIWLAVDWSNDYFIVTNQRVIWLERVVMFYDSRQEVPLSTLRSISVETSIIGRQFDYGNVIMKTFAGTVPFTNIGRPYQVASLIEEHWGRSKVVSVQEESVAMDRLIRRRLGLLPPEVKKPPVKQPEKQPKTSPWQNIFANFFRVRFQDQEVVTYRKHWYVLLLHIWAPSLLLLILLVLFVASFFKLGLLSIWQWPMQLITLFFGVIIFVWWLYQYIDWSNDIYQVTADQIIDIERKPLGRENKKAAPLENINNIESERTGFMGRLMNYGTVYINIAGTIFQFNSVFDPSQVQQDIFRRMYERNNKQQKADNEKERERLAEWFATYHRNAEDWRRQQEKPS